MLKPELFLGFPITEEFAKAVNALDPQLVALFTQGGDAYLAQASNHGVPYWGKSAGEISDLHHLEMLEKNIYSLLKRIIPDYPYEKTALVLFSAHSDEKSG